MSSPVMTMKDHRSLFRQLLAGMYDAVISKNCTPLYMV